METYFFSIKLSVTDSEQTYTFPSQLRSFTIINLGANDVSVEPENSIDNNSPIIPRRGSLEFKIGFQNIKYKTSSGASTIYIVGLKHEKS